MVSEAVSYLPFYISISSFRNLEIFCIVQYEGEITFYRMIYLSEI